ncbi:arylsulfatase A-like enzyme [Algoriphagus ratkowskyi]|uniref:Sulfatase n=1 Tax=Algoriphagus ratkowskyi TaxID=57028 RepID=A0A2W7R3T2_9BACT|nr:sulfatase [Algoriphagus ratkowskyi]PZX55488.1 arylsulfatase A-like enzyme [Algoriphagus ratkowskyi]TXD79595.1 sulfatase [Algoriphagus ratkowskyi]
MQKYIILSFLLILGSKSTFAQHKTQETDKPNVVLINVDDLGWADLGFMGSEYYETPNLDQLSEESKIFMHAYAAASNCAPSRATMITGRYPMTHGIYTVDPADRGNPKTRQLIASPNANSIPKDSYTLGNFFQDHGYRTGVFGKWHVSDDPLTYGFEVNKGGSHRGNPGKDGYFSPYTINLEAKIEGEYLTDRLTEEAISFVEENRGERFFLYLPFYTVHTPLMGKPELVEKYRKKEGSKGQNNPVYAAMIHSMDENVGRLLAALDSLNLTDKTLIIFTSDNGGIRATSHQDPLRAGKGSYYEGGIRVPLLIKWKNQITAGIENTPVTQLDFFPTFKALIDSESELKLDGESLLPLLKNKKPMGRDLFWHFPIYLEAYDPKEDSSRDPLFRTRPGSVIRSGNWKLHQYFEDGGLELYNLVSDPSESKNLATSNPKKAAELLKRLETWRFSYGAPIPSIKNPAYDAVFEKEAKEKVMK